KEVADRLEELRKEAQKILDRQAEAQRKGEQPNPADEARLREVNAERDIGTFEGALRLYETNYVDMGKPKPFNPATERQRCRKSQNVISAWQRVLVQARDDQWALLNASWPELPRCCVDGVNLITDKLDRAQEVAGRHALLNRLDLMNVRAQVVDAWRQLAIYANSLLAVFNVRYA